MNSSTSLAFAFFTLATFVPSAVVAEADGLRATAQRLRKPDQSSPIVNRIPGTWLKSAVTNPEAAIQEITSHQKEVETETDDLDAVKEVLDTILTSDFMSMPPTNGPTNPPTTGVPDTASTPLPTQVPTTPPTDEPTTASPTATPTSSTPAPTSAPTSGCGIPEEDRIASILAALDAVADPALIRDNANPQGLATTWLIQQDGYLICPDDEKLVQRWVLAVVYYSTNGDAWFQCSANPEATDLCGAEDPFVGDSRFLSAVNECEWNGISCIDGCVTEIEFEENNLVGTIATEIGLLKDLAVWGMERGGLTGTIPTEIGVLSNLIFLDLDFNELTGSLSPELLSLANLTQLDLNNNQMTGSVSGIGVFPDLEFLQLHDNFFTGTIPAALGDSTKLSAFTLHETSISGVMPESICDLLPARGNGGVLGSLIADCTEPNPDIVCTCCTDCRDT